MTPEQHLAHLKRLIQPPHTNGWWEYAKGRAEELALQDGELASLPILLRAERDRIAAEAKPSPPPQSTASSSKPTAPPKTSEAGSTHARTPAAMRPSITGQHASS